MLAFNVPRFALALALLATAGGCGLEELLVGAIVPEPATPGADVVPDGAAQLAGTLPGVTGEAALTFYGAHGGVIEPLTLDLDYGSSPPAFYAVLPVTEHHFNVRVVSTVGGVIRKAIVADPYGDGGVVTVDPLDAVSTALALALEVKPAGDTAEETPTPTAEARGLPAADGDGHLGVWPCEGVDAFYDALRGQIAAGTGPAPALVAAVSDAIAAGSTPWDAVTTSADELDDPVGSLALAAAESAAADGSLSADQMRVILGVVRVQSYPDHKCAPVDIDKWVNPTSGDSMFFTGGIHDDSPIQDATIQNQVFPNWVPNTLPMYDDGTHGDEVSGDDVWTLSFALPQGLRMGYKFTFGAQGENWTGTEEWPGNQRLLEVVDVNGDGYVARFDVFGDESNNKDKQNLFIPGGTDVTWDTDLDGDGFLEAQEQPADFVGGDCVRDGWWLPLTLPPVTTAGCF